MNIISSCQENYCTKSRNMIVGTALAQKGKVTELSDPGQWASFIDEACINLQTQSWYCPLWRRKCGHIIDRHLPWRMSKPGGWVSPSTMSWRVSGVVSRDLAKTSRPLLLTLLSILCLSAALPIWSKLPPIWDKNLHEESKKIQLLPWQVKKLS